MISIGTKIYGMHGMVMKKVIPFGTQCNDHCMPPLILQRWRVRCRRTTSWWATSTRAGASTTCCRRSPSRASTTTSSPSPATSATGKRACRSSVYRCLHASQAILMMMIASTFLNRKIWP